MTVPDLRRGPAIVTAPAEIDLTNREKAYSQLHAAFASGATVVVADLTATTFCDCGSMRGLLAVQDRAAVHGGQLRLAVLPGSSVRRVADLLGVSEHLPVYSGACDAIAGTCRQIGPAPRGPC